MKPRDLALAILLTAVAIIIPTIFTFLRVSIPPFTATLASHVPSMLAALISPAVAVLVGLGATLGFLIATGPVIAARAFIHVIWGYVGAVMIRRGANPWFTLFVPVMLIHAIGEAVVVVPFGYDLYNAGLVVGVGTVIHNTVDVLITMAVVALLRGMNIDLVPTAKVSSDGSATIRAE
ncbi:MAG TPA: ECF transporter S component [Bacillota bacterium]